MHVTGYQHGGYRADSDAFHSGEGYHAGNGRPLRTDLSDQGYGPNGAHWQQADRAPRSPQSPEYGYPQQAQYPPGYHPAQYPGDGYVPGTFRADYQADQYPGNGYQQPAYPQDGAYPADQYPPGAYPQAQHPHGMPQQGVPPQGVPPQGVPPQGVPPQGVPPRGVPPQGPYPQGANPSGPYPPGAYPQGPYPPGAYPPGQFPPGQFPPGAFQPGAYAPGPVPPGYPQGGYPPGAFANGAYPPGFVPPQGYPGPDYPQGAYPNAVYPPGVYPPGVYPHGAYPPGTYPGPGVAGPDAHRGFPQGATVWPGEVLPADDRAGQTTRPPGIADPQQQAGQRDEAPAPRVRPPGPPAALPPAAADQVPDVASPTGAVKPPPAVDPVESVQPPSFPLPAADPVSASQPMTEDRQTPPIPPRRAPFAMPAAAEPAAVQPARSEPGQDSLMPPASELAGVGNPVIATVGDATQVQPDDDTAPLPVISDELLAAVAAAAAAADDDDGPRFRDPFEPPDRAPSSEPESPGLSAQPEQGEAEGAGAAKLDQIKDLYLTAEAIGEDALDQHFQQVSDRQRMLIKEYFDQIVGRNADNSQTG